MAKAGSVATAGAPVGQRAALWRPAEARAEEREEKKLAVLATAAELFLVHGSHRVSMNDIAEQLGITKPAIYNYFASKDEILFECFRQSHLVTTARLSAIEQSDQSGLDRLRSFICAYSKVVAEGYGSVMVRLEDRDLSDHHRLEVRRFKSDIDARVRKIIEQGIEDGSIVPCGVKYAAFVVMGALNWIGQWYRSDGPASADEIGEQFAERLTVGFAKPADSRR